MPVPEGIEHVQSSTNQGLPDDRILLRQGFLRPESHGDRLEDRHPTSPKRRYKVIQASAKNFEDLILVFLRKLRAKR